MSTASRRWVKVWHEILTDAKFQDLSLEQQARFYNLLVYISAHGEKGYIEIASPCRIILSLLQCQNIKHLITSLNSIPLIKLELFSDNAKIGVTVLRWSKYQIDSTSYERVKKHRNTKNETVQEKEKEKEKIKKKIEKDIYGEFKNVKLTDGEYSKLIDKFQFQGTEQRIENLSGYLASKGDKYKSHYATILQWDKKNGGGNGTGRQYPKKQHPADRAAEIFAEIARERESFGDEDSDFQDISSL